MDHLFVSCPNGLEEILTQELRSLHITVLEQRFGGVVIPKSKENVFTVNYLSRVATRVLWPLRSFRCKGKEDLYYHSKKIPWSNFLSPRKTFAIDANVQHIHLKNSLFACFILKDALCDFFREATGVRPSVDTKFPDVQLNLFIHHDQATIYLDTSGAPLHKRAWRETSTEATLHESIAAALLLHVGYHPGTVFCDPFCGSGTFVVEAGLIGTHTPPGFFRKKWGFFCLPEMDKGSFESWKKQHDSKKIPLIDENHVFGSDKSRENSEICKKHLQKAGLAKSIRIDYQEIAYYNPPAAPDLIVCNPPYGKRLETSLQLFEHLKTFIEQKTKPHTRVYILTPESPLPEQAGLVLETKLSFKNGGLPVQLALVKSS